MVPVREYASTSEMVASLMAIRRRLLERPPVVHVIASEGPEMIQPEEQSEQPESKAEPFPLASTASANDNEAALVSERITVTDIIRTVARVWKVSTREITSARRTANVIQPRMAVYALACRLTPYSLPHIGRMIGGRDHTSVLHGREKMRRFTAAVDERLAPDAILLTWAEEMYREMNSGRIYPSPRL